MTYAAGSVISAVDYNTFAQGGAAVNHAVANVNTVWGAGTGQKGYGQTSTLTPVAATTDTVTAAQWATLISRLNSIATHQTGLGAGITAPTTGSTVAYLSTLGSTVSTLYTNAQNTNTVGATVTGANFNNGWSFATTTAAQSIVFDRTVTFSSAQAARYFFNAGGRLNYYITAVNNDGTGRSADQVTLATSTGGLGNFRSTTNSGRNGTGGTLNTNNTAVGYYNNTVGSPVTLVQVTSTTATYTGDYATIATTVATADTTNGANGSSLVFRFFAYSAAKAAAFNESVNVTYTTRIDVVNPETTNLTNTWGTITIS